MNFKERQNIKTMSEAINNTKTRMSGILLHPTSLPSPYGIGDLGQTAYDFVDFLCETKQTLWQVLPLGPTGYGDSPYQSFSSFAGQPLLISPDMLKRDGLLTDEDLRDIPLWQEDQVDYGYVLYYKTNLYKKAFTNFESQNNPEFFQTFQNFCMDNSSWLEDYALFMAVKDDHEGACWLDWEPAIREGNPAAKALWLTKLHREVTYYKFIQFLFFRQWEALKKYANEHGIFIVGDIPIFVALDSADAWANKKYFQLNPDGYPIAVSGVPPDYFSATGQLWGNPLYDWNALKTDNYKWWIERIRRQLALVDYLRIDHFRGFEAYWSVPYGQETAINGHWEKCPGADFFRVLEEVLGENLPIFAEDLGVITPEVEALRDDFHLPGMKVLQFAFENYDAYNAFLPHNYKENCICYTGTHDNDTTIGWYKTANDWTKTNIRRYTGSTDMGISWDFIKIAMASTAKYTIIPIQDVLCIGSEGRMNTPGKPSGNWSWRLKKSDLNPLFVSELRSITEFYAR